MIDLDELRKIAEEATPGPWWVGDPQPFVPGARIRIYHESGSPIRISGSDDRHVWVSPDGAFIATFNPETVLALLDRVEKAEREAEEFRDGATIVKLAEAEARIAEAAKLHRRRDDLEYRGGGDPVCDGCCDEHGLASKWPCPTAAALGLNEGENDGKSDA